MRPDLAAKTGQLQSVVTRARVKHLIDANRVLYEGKTHPVCLLLVPIPEGQVAFCAFSDASFSTSKDLSSRQGTLIFSTDTRLAKNQRTVVCPIAWSSKKIPRVVTSTLSAESITQLSLGQTGLYASSLGVAEGSFSRLGRPQSNFGKRTHLQCSH